MLPILAEDWVMSTNHLMTICDKLNERLRPCLQRLTVHVWDSHEWPEEVNFGKLNGRFTMLTHRYACLTSFTLRIHPERTPARFPHSPR